MRIFGWFGVCAFLLVAIACSFRSIVHPARVLAGDTFTSTLSIDHRPNGDIVPDMLRLCVGLYDPTGAGWDAKPDTWSITSGEGSPTSGTGVVDLAAAAALDTSQPEAAPWRCFNADTMPELNTNSFGFARMFVTAPRCVSAGTHTMRWRFHYHSDRPNGLQQETSIEVVPSASAAHVSAEPAGPNCLNGGNRIVIGCDSSGDGVPDVDTVDYYACNGVDGTDGQDGVTTAGTLIRLEPEPAGENCVSGGYRLLSGLDDGGTGGTRANGLLEEDEVESTQFVCNGVNGANGDDASGGCAAGGLPSLSALLACVALLRRRSWSSAPPNAAHS